MYQLKPWELYGLCMSGTSGVSVNGAGIAAVSAAVKGLPIALLNKIFGKFRWKILMMAEVSHNSDYQILADIYIAYNNGGTTFNVGTKTVSVVVPAGYRGGWVCLEFSPGPTPSAAWQAVMAEELASNWVFATPYLGKGTTAVGSPTARRVELHVVPIDFELPATL